MTKRILVIEDEKDLAEILTEHLMEAGYMVDVASDGEEGLDKAKTTSPDLIILDLKLPKMDGLNVCENLKQDPQYKKIPIIILTVRKTEYEKEVGYAAGADAYITKPYQAEVLLAKVEELLKY